MKLENFFNHNISLKEYITGNRFIDICHENSLTFCKTDNIDEYKMLESERLLDVLSKNNMVASNGEAKRLIKQGAVKIDDVKVSDMHLTLEVKEQVIKCGKRKFLKIVQ